MIRAQCSDAMRPVRFISLAVEGPFKPMASANFAGPPKASIRSETVFGDLAMMEFYRNSVAVVNRISGASTWQRQDMGDSNDRLKQARAEAHFTSAAKAAERFGWNESTYRSHENGQTDPVPVEDATKYEDAFKKPRGWILYGEARSRPANVRVSKGGKSGGIREIEPRSGLGGGGISTTEHRRRGQHIDGVKSERWHFPESFMLDELNAPADKLLVSQTRGTSMQPTIFDGERVIIDTRHVLPTPDGIYAIRDRWGMLIVKRLQVLRKGDPPRILIISDEHPHTPEEVGADEIEIVGRVICCLRRL